MGFFFVSSYVPPAFPFCPFTTCLVAVGANIIGGAYGNARSVLGLFIDEKIFEEEC